MTWKSSEASEAERNGDLDCHGPGRFDYLRAGTGRQPAEAGGRMTSAMSSSSNSA